MNVLVTGARGFVGRNVCVALHRRRGIPAVEYDIENTAQDLAAALQCADVILHLAGANRPRHSEEFAAVNTGLTRRICELLRAAGRAPKIVLSSSVQAELDNPYGVSKREAEEVLRRYCEESGAEGVAYRLTNLFGKWCRPNYNSVTATFCHNISHDLPIEISDPSRQIDLTYVDDVVSAFVGETEAAPRPGFRYAEPLPSYRVTLSELAELIRSFRSQRESLRLPNYGDRFVRALYATYLSYVEPKDAEYGLDIKADPRGTLAEFVKSPVMGQVFVSRTQPGVTRGNHYHDTKTEKFLVVEGEGLIRLRQIHGDEVTELRVRGEDYRVVDILPGYTHSIENVGPGEMVTLFWANEIFDPATPDTWAAPVLREGEKE